MVACMENERDITTNLNHNMKSNYFFQTNVKLFAVGLPRIYFYPPQHLFRTNLFSYNPQHLSPISLEKWEEKAEGEGGGGRGGRGA